MDMNLQELLDLTDDLRVDILEENHAQCVEHLQRRETLLGVILEEYGAATGRQLPDDIRTVLNHVQQVDSELEQILKQRMNETGKEIARVNDIKSRNKSTQPKSCCLNRQA